ncbi:MAG: TetR/AcrR family transcriptional regulator [Coprobacter sp.]|nr:TetR/AcrR family transcriptional regulator [Coprobacter sp.]
MNTELRERIVGTASVLFERNGIKSVTMDAIAGQMGISKRTLYETFRDKDELLMECFVYQHRETEAETDRIVKTSSNSMEILLRVFFYMLRKLRTTNRNFYSDMKKYHASISVMFEDDRREHLRNAARLMEQGKEEGLIRADLKLEIVSMLLKAQFEIWRNTDDFDTSRYSFVEIFETIFMNFFRGIATAKGAAFIEEFIAKHQE